MVIQKEVINVLGMSYKKYLQCYTWKSTRDAILKRDEYKCQFCWRRKDVNLNLTLHVHHLNYENVGSEKGRDLITLCNKCHKREHETR